MAWYQQMDRGLWSPTSWLRQALHGFDNPESVTMADTEVDEEESLHLQAALELRSGDAVSAYACSVAMALEGRSRSSYNPCSAREGHIMLQLKRSLEAASRAESDMSDAPCGRRLLCIWRMALEAGKSIRSKAASKAAGWAVAEEVLAAQVAKCRGKLRGFRYGHAISQLRESAMELVDMVKLEDPRCARRRVQRLLHKPSLALKEGKEVNVTKILQEVELQLRDLS
eukprot:symbB.v1.2.029086.t1/scaffold3150.1/size62411/4